MGKIEIRTSLLIAAIFSLTLVGLSSAAAVKETAEPQKPPAPYSPGLGDFMTAYVQPHHIKVGLAGHAANWPLAQYEAKELRETFEDVTAYQGVWHDFPIAKLAEANLDPPLAELDKAIADKSPANFKRAYDHVTAACNSCHQATNNAFIVIKTPASSDFPDQQFQPR